MTNMPDHAVTWSFWLRLPEGSQQPSFVQAKEAMLLALPDFSIDFITEDLGGNPRDGYLHPVRMVAHGNGAIIISGFGGYISFHPTVGATSQYELSGFAPSVTSSLPWMEQERIWRAVADAFASLGYVDSTMEGEDFVRAIEEAKRLLA